MKIIITEGKAYNMYLTYLFGKNLKKRERGVGDYHEIIWKNEKGIDVIIWETPLDMFRINENIFDNFDEFFNKANTPKEIKTWIQNHLNVGDISHCNIGVF